MFPFNNFNFPFSDYNKINLDWICELLSKLRGGNDDQFLRKKSGEDYDFEWTDSVNAGVTSVNGQTGDVTLSIPTKTSQLTNDSGFITAAGAPVQSVNNKTGDVVLMAADIGAGTYSLPAGGIPYGDLDSDVQDSLDAADVALPAQDCRIKFFKTVDELQLTVGSATIAQAVYALRTKTNAQLMCPASDFDAAEVPTTVGCVRIWVTSANRPVIEFLSRADTVGSYMMFTDSDNIPSGLWVSTFCFFKDISISLTTNNNVSPFSTYGSASGSIGGTREFLGCSVISAASNNPVTLRWTGTAVAAYGAKEETITVRIAYR